MRGLWRPREGAPEEVAGASCGVISFPDLPGNCPTPTPASPYRALHPFSPSLPSSPLAQATAHHTPVRPAGLSQHFPQEVFLGPLKSLVQNFTAPRTWLALHPVCCLGSTCFPQGWSPGCRAGACSQPLGTGTPCELMEQRKRTRVEEKQIGLKTETTGCSSANPAPC